MRLDKADPDPLRTLYITLTFTDMILQGRIAKINVQNANTGRFLNILFLMRNKQYLLYDANLPILLLNHNCCLSPCLFVCLSVAKES